MSGSSESGSVYPLSSMAPQQGFLACCTKPREIHICTTYAEKNPTDASLQGFTDEFSTSHAVQPFCIFWFHPWVMRVGPDLQNLFWYFSAYAHPCLRLSSIQLHPLWFWSPHHQQTHSSYTIQALGQVRQIHSLFSSMLFLLALWWGLRRWGERWESQWRWWITAQVGGSFVLLSFFNMIHPDGNWKKDWEATCHLNKP